MTQRIRSPGTLIFPRDIHFKHSAFRTDISNHNWDFLSSSKDPNELWSEWKSNFLAIADKNVPICTKRVRSETSPWITADLKNLMYSRDIMKIKAINSTDPNDWACFKRMRNKVSVAIRQAKELFYKNKFSKFDGDPRKTWQVINELISRKTGRSSVRELSLNGVSITNSTDFSNAFNDHFSTIGSKLASEIPFNNGSSIQEYISGRSERFQLVSTDSNQVLSLFKTLNKSKGAGLDGITSRLILDCADLIAPHNSVIFNSSLANGIFPDDWKSTRVTPPFKHGKEAI